MNNMKKLMLKIQFIGKWNNKKYRKNNLLLYNWQNRVADQIITEIINER